jgi:glycogen operon protein
VKPSGQGSATPDRSGRSDPTGSSSPLGPTTTSAGTNFSLFSRHASGVDLLLFDDVEADRPAHTITLDPGSHRTGDYWHVFVPGIGPGQAYAYRARGPFSPVDGLRFDADAVLLDPYGRGVAVPADYRREVVDDPVRRMARAMKSVIVDLDGYDWEGDRPLGRPLHETIVYEAHVRGFTAHPGSGVPVGRGGTYAGFIDKIPYLVELGVTAVELLPIFQFDRWAAPDGLVNYWGYQPVSYFAPHAAYASGGEPQGAIDEFRALVKALHRAGLELILDVVYNHTAEGGPDDPTFCFRGLANDDYYRLADDRSRYADYTGTGNSLDANNPVVRRLILDSLEYWVREMHVDGFRFDLAAVLSRDEAGRAMVHPPTLEDIELDPVLAGTKLIAEAWDAGGLYQVGSFVGERWLEWNGRFRDDVRSFVKSDGGAAWAIGQRFLASPDIYGPRGRPPQATINFVSCHDGFTLNDLVSYDGKHNDANGEDDRDGNDQNLSWNCGVEGPTDDPDVERLRRRQIKNFLAIELLALGVPMLLMGDEVRRTQRGNNNAYCHDDELTWFDWSGPERHGDILRFTRSLIGARRRLTAVLGGSDEIPLLDLLRAADVTWSGVQFGQPDLGPASRSLALTIGAPAGSLELLLNAYWDGLEFELPPPDPELEPWRRVIDTTNEAPDDFIVFEDAPPVRGATCPAGPRSVVVLAARRIAAPADADRGTARS